MHVFAWDLNTYTDQWMLYDLKTPWSQYTLIISVGAAQSLQFLMGLYGLCQCWNVFINILYFTSWPAANSWWSYMWVHVRIGYNYLCQQLPVGDFIKCFWKKEINHRGLTFSYILINREGWAYVHRLTQVCLWQRTFLLNNAVVKQQFKNIDGEINRCFMTLTLITYTSSITDHAEMPPGLQYSGWRNTE